MASKSKYIGKVFDYRWKVADCKIVNDHIHYIFENIYNGRKLEVSSTSFYDLLHGKTTIDRIITSRIRKKENGRFNTFKF